MSDAGVVIVGAGLGGVRTAERLREHGYDGPITLLGADPDPPYDRPPLSKQVLRGERDIVPLRDPASYADIGVDLRRPVTATALRPTERMVDVDGDGIPYTRLVVATGARPRTLPGLDGVRGVHVLRTARDCVELHAHAQHARTAIVVGGGFIGCEVAASLRVLGLDVTIVELAAAPLAPVLGDEVAALVVRLHESEGVRIIAGVAVTSIDRNDGAVRVRLSDGRALAADLVVVGLGVAPETAWLTDSGVSVDDGIVCDERGRAGVPDVFAVGDCARWRQPRSGTHRRFEHWTSAVEQAAVVAEVIATGDAPAYDAVPYFWSDQYRVKIQSLGVPSPTAAVTIVDISDRKRVALYAEDGVLSAVVGFSAPSVVMSQRAALSERTPIERAVRDVESRRTVTA